MVRHQLAGSRRMMRAELVVFARGRGGLQILDLQLLVFALEGFNFLEQLAAGQEGVGGAARKLPGGADGSEQGQKQAADAEFEV